MPIGIHHTHGLTFATVPTVRHCQEDSKCQVQQADVGFDINRMTEQVVKQAGKVKRNKATVDFWRNLSVRSSNLVN